MAMSGDYAAADVGDGVDNYNDNNDVDDDGNYDALALNGCGGTC